MAAGPFVDYISGTLVVETFSYNAADVVRGVAGVSWSSIRQDLASFCDGLGIKDTGSSGHRSWRSSIDLIASFNLIRVLRNSQQFRRRYRKIR